MDREQIAIIVEKNHLSIHWNEREKTNFWYAWLYDNAPGRRHANGQKLYETRDVNLTVQPLAINWDHREIVISWPDGEATYDLSSLRPKKKLRLGSRPKLWACFDKHEVHHYPTVSEDPTALLQCLKDVQLYGFARLREVPADSGSVLDLVSLFGYVRETNYGKFYDVIAKRTPDNLADTNLELPCHTDNPYRDPTPTIQILHCLEADVVGGKTILVDGFFLAEKLREDRPSFFNTLVSNAVQFEFATDNHILQNEAPIIELGLDGHPKRIKFNSRSIQPFRLADADLLPFYRAYQYWENLLHDKSLQLRFLLSPGQAIIYDNERILHGRTSFELKSKRHLQGCYADRDALFSKIKILEKALANE